MDDEYVVCFKMNYYCSMMFNPHYLRCKECQNGKEIMEFWFIEWY